MKKNKKNLGYEPDSYDIGFVKALSTLQSKGRCRNEAILEKNLELPQRIIYKIKTQRNGVPKKYRDKILVYLKKFHDVNPEIFSNPHANLFLHNPPQFTEAIESYKPFGRKPSSGDILYLERLELENEFLQKENDLLKKLVKNLEAGKKGKGK